MATIYKEEPLQVCSVPEEPRALGPLPIARVKGSRLFPAPLRSHSVSNVFKGRVKNYDWQLGAIEFMGAGITPDHKVNLNNQKMSIMLAEGDKQDREVLMFIALT